MHEKAWSYIAETVYSLLWFIMELINCQSLFEESFLLSSAHMQTTLRIFRGSGELQQSILI